MGREAVIFIYRRISATYAYCQVSMHRAGEEQVGQNAVNSWLVARSACEKAGGNLASIVGVANMTSAVHACNSTQSSRAVHLRHLVGEARAIFPAATLLGQLIVSTFCASSQRHAFENRALQAMP
eukprot:SAG11_NODE_801_length_7112_cov_6.438329_7_plen_125_part_00